VDVLFDTGTYFYVVSTSEFYWSIYSVSHANLWSAGCLVSVVHGNEQFVMTKNPVNADCVTLSFRLWTRYCIKYFYSKHCLSLFPALISSIGMVLTTGTFIYLLWAYDYKWQWWV